MRFNVGKKKRKRKEEKRAKENALGIEPGNLNIEVIELFAKILRNRPPIIQTD